MEPIIDKTVILRGEAIGGRRSANVGFEYRDARHPDLIPSDIVSTNLIGTSFNATANNILNGNEYKYRAFYDEGDNIVYGEWLSFTPANILETAILSPITTSQSFDMNILENVVLSNIIIQGFYFNLDESSDSGFDFSDQSVCLGRNTDFSQINNLGLGSEELKEKFSGIMLKLASGQGSVTVNAKTSGNAQLVVQVGNQTPMIAARTEQGDVVVNYDVAEDTYVYIYAILGSSNTRMTRASSDDVVKIYGIRVSPDGLGVKDIKTIVNLIFSGSYDAAADVNGDGTVNIADIVTKVNQIVDNDK